MHCTVLVDTDQRLCIQFCSELLPILRLVVIFIFWFRRFSLSFPPFLQTSIQGEFCWLLSIRPSSSLTLLSRYQFGGQPYFNDFLSKNFKSNFTSAFGEKNGKAMMAATAGSWATSNFTRSRREDTDSRREQFHWYRRNRPPSPRCPQNQATVRSTSPLSYPVPLSTQSWGSRLNT